MLEGSGLPYGLSRVRVLIALVCTLVLQLSRSRARYSQGPKMAPHDWPYWRDVQAGPASGVDNLVEEPIGSIVCPVVGRRRLHSVNLHAARDD